MVDEEKVKKAVALLLEGIGEDPTREGLQDTPARVAKMYREICGGMDHEAKEYLQTTFASTHQGIVLEKDIPFYSTCEHHMLPFYGTVSIAYIADGRVAGLSKLARTVEVFARRLQIQEHMTDQIADAVMEVLHAKGVMVVVTAEHMCMSMRGVQKPGTKTTTVTVKGVFEEDNHLQQSVYMMLK